MKCVGCQHEFILDATGRCPVCGRALVTDADTTTIDPQEVFPSAAKDIDETIDAVEPAYRNAADSLPATVDGSLMITPLCESEEIPRTVDASLTLDGGPSAIAPDEDLAASVDPTLGTINPFGGEAVPVTLDPTPGVAEGTIDLEVAPDLAMSGDLPATLDGGLPGPSPDPGETAQTMISEDLGAFQDSEETAGTIAMDGDRHSSRTLVSEDLDDVGTVQLTEDAIQAAAGNVEAALRTIHANFDDSSANDNPRMTIKSRGKESVLETGLLGETLGMVPQRSMKSLTGQEESATSAAAEYELLKVLGEGGMGVVWSARQTSVDRMVALKMIKGPQAEKKSQRQKFLAEAIVTGDLDHPNIVPIYDVGSDPKGSLFYAMKQVKGTPWLKVLDKKSLHENLEILLRVADAIAFSHSRGILHRDLKPENVMLGEYGEVLVMDWGLALATGSFEKARLLRRTTSMGGTPAYMAPEMATGPIDRITPRSDVYLLGAILWELVTGYPPHPGKKVQDCLLAAIRNEIRPTDKTGELINIARKALATDPGDRYQTVPEFQQALRGYLSHSESVTLASRAEQDLQQAIASQDYRDFSKAVFGFEEAYELWDGNTVAAAGVVGAKREYAAAALAKGDFDLGMSLLSPGQPEHEELLKRLRAASAERTARQQRLRVAKRVMAGMATGMFLVVSVAFLWIRAERNFALEQQEIAVDEANKAKEAQRLEAAARVDADAQRRLAETKRREAEAAKEQEAAQRLKAEEATRNALAAKEQEEEQRKKAEQATRLAMAAREEEARQRIKAEQATKAADAARVKEEAAKIEALAAQREEANQRMKAEAATKAAEAARIKEELAKVEEQKQRVQAEQAREAEKYKAYIAGIGLAAAKIEENAFDVAAVLLDQCPVELRHWEWGRLKHLCDQSSSVMPSSGPVDDVALSPDGTRAATAGWDGKARLWQVETGKMILEIPYDGLYVHSVAWAPDGSLLAVSGNSPRSRVLLVDPTDGREVSRLSGHEDAVVKVRFSPDGRCLITCSYDQTARLWDVTDPRVPRLMSTLDGHSWWVWDAAFQPGFDLTDPHASNRIVTVGQDGRAIVWRLAAPNSNPGDADVTDVALAPKSAGPIVFKRQAVFAEHSGPVYAVAFLPNGLEVVTGGYDKRILLWKPAEIPDVRVESILQESDKRIEVREFLGHTGPVQSLAVSRDGELLVSGGRDNAVKAWEIATGKPIQTFRGHSSGVRSVAITPDGRRILSAGQDQRTITWSVDGYAEFRVLGGRRLSGHADAVLSAVFSRDGSAILTAGRDRTARLWDEKTGTLTRTFEEGHEYLTSKGLFFGGRRTLVTAAADNTVRLWNVAAGTQILKLDGTGRTAPLAVSPDERWLVTGGEENEAKLWSITDLLSFVQQSPELQESSAPAPARLLTGHNGRVTAVTFSPSGNELLTCDANGRCRLQSVETGQLLWDVRHHTRRITGCEFTADGSQILTSSLDHTVGRIHAATGEELPNLILGHDSPVSALALSPDGSRVLTVSPGADAEPHLAAKLTLWETASARELAAVEVNGFGVNGIAFGPDQTSALAVGTDNTVRVFTLPESGSRTDQGQVWLDFQQLGGLVWSATFTDEFRSVLTVGGSEARLWDAETRREKMSFSPHGTVAAADFSPDGTRIATGSWDHSIKVWDVASGQALFKLDGEHQGFVNSIQFSPDGQFLLSASDDGTARLWEIAGRKVVQVYRGHQGRVRQAVFSSDGTRVLTVGNDRTARIWETSSARPIGEPLQGHRWSLLCGRFSPDGRRILTGSEDQTAILWDVESGHALAALRGHTAAVTSVAFSPDGRRVFTASQDNSAKLWDATPGHEGQEILTLQGHTEELTAIAFSPDGRQVLTGGRDGTAVLWPTGDWSIQDGK